LATVQEAGAVMFARPDRTARMSLEHGLSELLSLSERPLTGLRKKVAQKIGPQAMAQCGSGNALPVFEFRKNVVSDGFQGGSRGVQESMPNRMPERVSPFDLADHACRPDCGACCIAPSISSPIPGMPHGKPAGVRCVQLGDDLRCAIFGQPERPACCSGLQPQTDMCGVSRAEALAWLTQLEIQTQPRAVARQ
jgi:hypothetical protein